MAYHRPRLTTRNLKQFTKANTQVAVMGIEARDKKKKGRKLASSDTEQIFGAWNMSSGNQSTPSDIGIAISTEIVETWFQQCEHTLAGRYNDSNDSVVSVHQRMAQRRPASDVEDWKPIPRRRISRFSANTPYSKGQKAHSENPLGQGDIPWNSLQEERAGQIKDHVYDEPASRLTLYKKKYDVTLQYARRLLPAQKQRKQTDILMSGGRSPGPRHQFCVWDGKVRDIDTDSASISEGENSESVRLLSSPIGKKEVITPLTMTSTPSRLPSSRKMPATLPQTPKINLPFLDAPRDGKSHFLDSTPSSDTKSVSLLSSGSSPTNWGSILKQHVVSDVREAKADGDKKFFRGMPTSESTAEMLPRSKERYMVPRLLSQSGHHTQQSKKSVPVGKHTATVLTQREGNIGRRHNSNMELKEHRRFTPTHSEKMYKRPEVEQRQDTTEAEMNRRRRRAERRAPPTNFYR
ncbi:hypothetical protein BP6252_03667 [Coleophoma cylindrospora]|uniref:Uncharacterized protein n=1 Tax=Coleophoma cylindrospora TaxID=1849047 RepID=A0A3D8S885_9HELO|nr:hypothetical protein BP6252_03667 [Coleophoma cylindrospora]